jgi:hypothetical protein
MVTRFLASLRTDNRPQRKEARPLSHALTSDGYNSVTPRHGLVRRWLLIGYFPIHLLPRPSVRSPRKPY